MCEDLRMYHANGKLLNFASVAVFNSQINKYIYSNLLSNKSIVGHTS